MQCCFIKLISYLICFKRNKTICHDVCFYLEHKKVLRENKAKLRVSNRPDLGGTVSILTENPESRLDLSQDAKCGDFEKQRSCREVIDQNNSLDEIFRVIL